MYVYVCIEENTVANTFQRDRIFLLFPSNRSKYFTPSRTRLSGISEEKSSSVYAENNFALHIMTKNLLNHLYF